MSVSSRHLLAQRGALAATAEVAWDALLRRARPFATRAPPSCAPLACHEAVIAAPSRALLRAYVEHLGGDPRAYRDRLPFHMFPQWSFAVATRALRQLPYALSKLLNVGCSVEVHALPRAAVRLRVRAQVDEVDDDGRRALLTTRIVTSTEDGGAALTARLYALIPLSPRSSQPRRERAARPETRVPEAAQAVAALSLDRRAGLDFAKLTGDFNPIHWYAPAARAAGFPGVILHGFGTMARTIEVLQRSVLEGDVARIKRFCCRFTKPLVLPAQVAVYTQGSELFVGSAVGLPAHMLASYET